MKGVDPAPRSGPVALSRRFHRRLASSPRCPVASLPHRPVAP